MLTESLIRPSFFVAVAATLVLSGCDEQEAAPEIPIRPVISMVIGDVERFRTDVYPGRAEATQEVNISFQVSGRMVERPVDVGTSVAAGDVLAVLDPSLFEAEVRRLSR